MKKIKVTMEDILDFLEHPENNLTEDQSINGDPSLNQLRRYSEIMTDILNKKELTNELV